MEIVIKLTDNDLKDNLVINTINNLFKLEKTIVAPQTEIDDCDFVENVVKPKIEVNDTDKELKKLKDFANGIYKQLNEKSQKSLKKFVEFYTEKIVNNGFRINPKNNWEKWIANDKNLK